MAEPPADGVRDTWGACARAWLIAWLLVSALVLVFLAMVLATQAVRPAPPVDPGQPIVASVHALDIGLVALVAALHGIAIALALLVALPLQTTALRLRRAGDGSATLAGVAALTSVSAVLSFLVLYGLNRPLLHLMSPSGELLAAVLAAVYLAHVGILLIARRRMRRTEAEPKASL